MNFKLNKRRLFAISINQLNFTSVGTDVKKKKNDVPVDNSFLIWLPVHFFFCARFPPQPFYEAAGIRDDIIIQKMEGMEPEKESQEFAFDHVAIICMMDHQRTFLIFFVRREIMLRTCGGGDVWL